MVLIIINAIGLLFISPSGMPTEQRIMAMIKIKRLPTHQRRTSGKDAKRLRDGEGELAGEEGTY